MNVMIKRSTAVSAAVLVTLMWSSSYFLNKAAFEQGIGPFTLAGLRFLIGAAALSVCLLPGRTGAAGKRSGVAWQREEAGRSGRIPVYLWILLGLTGYAAAQGLQYAGQKLLAPTQVSLLLSAANTLLVLGIDRLGAKEAGDHATRLGSLAMIAGIALFYFPWRLSAEDGFGIGLVLLSSAGYAIHLSLNRSLLGRRRLSPLPLTLIPMAIGGCALLAVGLSLEDLPKLGPALLTIIVWLGVVNGAGAFILWTWSQKFLSAADSSLINNLMLVEIALLEVLLLHRKFEVYRWAAIALVLGAVLFTQLRRRRL
ncbi:DMT family transporter [Saccharibacillus sp. CPCC 101409]|uniref:DMT family transporter n=1 Tax=Saccharibacillus sp. CPCC 101409 TaxID=3058041 RepID=UPI002673EC67|nr:DMT family transporter [Saccharibacillus sp. CPCC 101409]MDO3408718.1 DMT family transporter [Saccharibacillus sp. CPCC 101409]